MVNWDAKNEMANLFKMLDKLVAEARTRDEEEEVKPKQHSCGGQCNCTKDPQVNEPEQDNIVDDVPGKDIEIPFPCEGELTDLKAVYNKETHKMMLSFKTDYTEDGVKIEATQNIAIDCSELPVDNSTIDVEHDPLGAVIFSANLLRSAQKTSGIVEFL